MNKIITLSAAAACLLFAASCSEETTSTTSTGDTTMTTMAPAGATENVMVLSETDPYIDLKTGKSIKIRRDATNNQYVTEDMSPLDIYVNTSTMDTFYGPTGMRVNGYLLRDPAGAYSVDPMYIEQNGDGYKAKSADGSMKVKDNGEELKIKDGDVKIKSTDDEYKYKDGDTKIKSNEDKTKIKTADSKTEIDHKTGEVTTKPR